MAILNRASDGLVGVLVAIVRANVAVGVSPKEKLLDIVSPKSLSDQDMATKTLNRWLELGLFVTSEKGEVKLQDDARAAIKSKGIGSNAIAHIARRIVLAPNNNDNFWSDTENRSADFSRAAAWMLAQDVYDFMPTSHSSVEPLCNDQAQSNDVILLQNDTRWNGYKSWAAFLGFGRSESGKASGGFITDPTPVVHFHLADLLPKKGEVGIDEFLLRLASTVPVLDGGDYRKEVESKLKPDSWSKPKEGELSTSLSRALLRLREAGYIRFEARSDSGAQASLVGRKGRVIESLTHVRRGDVN
jgi:hypothetical protein